MPYKYSILSVCSEDVLARSRNAVLQTCGAHIVDADQHSAPLKIANQFFDLIVVCHSVEDPQRALILLAAEKRVPAARVLLLDTPLQRTYTREDGIDRMDAGKGPEALVRKVLQLLEKAAMPRPVRGEEMRPVARGSA
jgi:hypothetical protein